MKVKKAIIPVAGLGTRFLPATKTVPKELLPIVDKPGLLYIVEEAVEAGIKDIIFIAGRNKEAIEDFFDVSYELEKKLEEANRLELLDDLVKLRDKVNFISVRQQKPLGLGHAIYCANSIIGSDPFAVLLGDELSWGPKKATQELVEQFNTSKNSTVAIMEVPMEQTGKYGVVKSTKIKDCLYQIEKLVEKPKPEEAPSNLALPGRYVFTSEIMKFLEDTRPGRNGEIQLTDAMDAYCKNLPMHGLITKAKRYDAGDKFGYLVANIELALERKDLGSELRIYLKKLAETL